MKQEDFVQEHRVICSNLNVFPITVTIGRCEVDTQKLINELCSGLHISKQELFDTLNNIVKNKNSDYSGDEDAFANFREAEYIREEYKDWATEFGLKTRILDKINRIKNLSKRKGGEGEVIDEKIIDTKMDLLNYTIILMMWWEYNGLNWYDGKMPDFEGLFEF